MTKAKFVVNRPPPPYDRGWAWLVVLGMFLNCFIMMGTMKSYGLILEALLDRFDISVALASLPVSLAGIIYALASPIMLMLSERYTIRPIVILGGIFGFVGLSLSSLLFSIEYFTVMFALGAGSAYSCFYANGLVMVGFYFRKRLSLATGLGLAGSSIGQFLMPPIFEYLLETFTLPGTLAIIAGIHLNAAVAGMLFRPLSMYGPEPTPTVASDSKLNVDRNGEAEALVPPPAEVNGHVKAAQDEVKTNGGEAKIVAEAEAATQDRLLNGSDVDFRFSSNSETLNLTYNPTETDEDDDDDDVANVEKLTSSNQQLAVLATKTPKKPKRRLFDFSAIYSHVTKFYLTATLFVFFGYFNFVLYLPPVIGERGFEGYDKAMLLSFIGVGDLVARVGTGFIADFKFIERYKIQIMTAILCGFNVFMALYANTFAWMAFHFTCYGLFGGAFVSIMSVVLLDFVGRDLMARNLAVMMPVHGIGASLGQILLGYLKDVTGTYDVVIVILSVCLLAGGVMLLFYPMVRRWEDRRLERLAARQAVKAAAKGNGKV